VIALLKETKATKYSDNRTVSFVTDTGKIVARILRGRKGKETDDTRGENVLGY
jgi:hypothetical protein